MKNQKRNKIWAKIGAERLGKIYSWLLRVRGIAQSSGDEAMVFVIEDELKNAGFQGLSKEEQKSFDRRCDFRTAKECVFRLEALHKKRIADGVPIMDLVCAIRVLKNVCSYLAREEIRVNKKKEQNTEEDK